MLIKMQVCQWGKRLAKDANSYSRGQAIQITAPAILSDLPTKQNEMQERAV